MSPLPRLLIVDDEPELCQIIAETLETAFDCTCCFDPVVVLELIDENDYDLILTDVQMPKVDAEAIIRASQKKAKRAPVILMSGNNRADPIVQKTLSVGAVDVIPKPLPSLEEFTRILQSHLRKT